MIAPSGTGIDWRSGETGFYRWPDRTPYTVTSGQLTYRGNTAGLATPGSRADGDVPVGNLQIMSGLDDGPAGHAATFFRLLAHHPARTITGPAVLAVPAWLATDRNAVRRLHETVVGHARIPVTRIVAAPLAAAAWAHHVQTLTAPPIAAPVLVCDLDGPGATITPLAGANHTLTCGTPDVVAIDAQDPDRTGTIGAAVAAAATAVAGNGAVRLLICGTTSSPGDVLSAADARYRGPVHLLPVGDPRQAVAAGAAAIAAGVVEVADCYPAAVAVAAHSVVAGMITETWPLLAEADTLAPGQAGPSTQIEVAAGRHTVTVRLTGDSGDLRADLPMPADLPTGTYTVRVTVDSDGAALLFETAGTEPVRIPLPSRGHR